MCTFIFAVIVLVVTIPLAREVLNDLMEASPDQVDTSQIHDKLSSIEGVQEVPDIHVWRLGNRKVVLSAHLTLHANGDACRVVRLAEETVSAVGISHTTFQTCYGGTPL